MSKSTSPTRKAGAAVSVAALALSVFTGSALGYGGIELERDCSQPGAGFAQTQCSFNVATPSGDQWVGQSADNTNVFEADQELYQEQVSVQEIHAPTFQIAEVDDVEGGDATIVTKSGEVYTRGHSLDLFLGANVQVATASPHGMIFQKGESGSADGKAFGDVQSYGGDASAYQKSVSVIDAYADLFAPGAEVGGSGGDTGRAYGGDVVGNDVYGGNGGWNVAVGLQSASGAATSGESEAEAEAEAKMESDLNGGDGAEATQGANTGGAAASGAGGAGGAGTFNPVINQLTGTPAATSSGTATGGSADSVAQGHVVGGGISGDVLNQASMNGGQAVNGFTLNIAQSGNQTGTSGTATNSGSASAPVNININQNDASTLSQAQDPTFTGGSTIANAGGQAATSGAQTADPTQSVSSGTQTADGENEVEDSFQVNDNEVEVKIPIFGGLPS